MPTATPIKRGAIVELNGLVKTPKMNGKKGLCLDFLSSKQRFMIKLISGGQPILVKEANLVIHDPMYEAVYGTAIGSITECNKLMDAIVLHFNWGYQSFPPCRPLGQFDQTPNARRSIYQFLPWAVGHEFNLDMIKCADGAVFGRVFQAYLNEYSAKDWLEKQFWMNADEMRCFFSDLDQLQRMVDTFVTDDLIASLVIPPGESPVEFARAEAKRAAACSVQHGIGPFSLGVQPRKWDDASIKEYCKIHQNDCPDHVVRGGLTMTHPDHPRDGDIFLAFRVRPWSDIMQLSQKLFNGAGLLFPLAALTHNGMGWLYRCVRINTDDEAFNLV